MFLHKCCNLSYKHAQGLPLYFHQGASKSNGEAKSRDATGTLEAGTDNDVEMNEEGGEDDNEVSHTVDVGKKDPSLRRQELLISSGLAEVCSSKLKWNVP